MPEMNKIKARFPVGAVIRSYEQGDEKRIVDFLNLCFGEWGTVKKWRYFYSDYPTFNKDDVILVEIDGEIVGHGGIHFRDLTFQKRKLYTASLTDAAVHPSSRGRGLYSELVDARFKKATSRGACLVFAWHLKGSNAYKHNKRAGFIEVKQFPAYMKVIRPEKVMKGGLFDLVHKNQRLKEVLQDLKFDFCFCIGNFEVSVAELLGRVEKKLAKNEKVKVVLDENAVFVMANFRNMSQFEIFSSMIMLILSRRAKIRFTSFNALLNLARKGVEIIGSL